jgi:hypothetical protein
MSEARRRSTSPSVAVAVGGLQVRRQLPEGVAL